MIRALLCLILPLMLLCSCKKERAVAVKKYKITYNISGFTQQITGSADIKKEVTSLRTDAVADLTSTITFLKYSVTNSSGTIVSKVSQDSSFSSFGNITDYLEAGTYTVTFVGYKGALNVNGFPRNDTFSETVHITVSAGDVTQTVNLHRVVGQLTFDITDALPPNASTIVLTASEVSGYDYVYDNTIGQAYAENVTYHLSTSDIGTLHYKRSVFIFNTSYPFTATISCYDATNKLIAQAAVNDVSLQKNTQTILTGNLFASDHNFTVSLNQAWDVTPINIPF